MANFVVEVAIDDARDLMQPQVGHSARCLQHEIARSRNEEDHLAFRKNARRNPPVGIALADDNRPAVDLAMKPYSIRQPVRVIGWWGHYV
jgi:hypothetical protein